MIKNVKRGIKYKYFDCFLEYTNFKDDVIGYKCKYKFKFYNQNNNKFFLLFRKGV